MKLLVILVVPFCLSALTVVVSPSNMGAALSYIAPNGSACTDEVSLSNTYLPLVYDVDPTLYTNANLDSRTRGALSNGTSRIFFVGTRGNAELALDSNYYSRVLQVETTYYYRVTCSGPVVATGSFTTKNLPAGDLRGDLPLVNPTTSYWDIPTWTGSRGQPILDPLYGTLAVRQTITSDMLGSPQGLIQGNGGLTRPHTNKLFTSGDGKLGYVSCYWDGGAGGEMYFFIPSTGEVRYIGHPSGITYPVMRDDKTFLQYRSDLTPTGLYNIPYTGTFMSGDYATGTPVLNVSDASGGVCEALFIYDATRFPTPFTTYTCAAIPTYANEYSSFFLQNFGLPAQDSPGVEGVMWGGDGRPYDSTCSAGPTLCPHLVAAYIVGVPFDTNGCVNHNNQLWTTDLVELNLKSNDNTCPGGYASVIFWKFPSDPNGTSLAPGPWGYGGHQDIKNPSPYTSNGSGIGPTASMEENSSYCIPASNGCAYDGVVGFPQSSYVGIVTPGVMVGAYNAFAGAGYGGWGLVRHPNWEQDVVQTTANTSVNQANTFFDSIPFAGAGGPGPPNDIDISSVTLVGGKTRTWDIGLFSPLNRKQQDTVVKSAGNMFADVSGTGTNRLCDTSGCAGQYCIPKVSGECFSGDVVGHNYINPLDTGFAHGCAAAEAPNNGVTDICIIDNTTQLMMMAQLWGTGPSDGYLKSRMLGHGLSISSSWKQSGSTFKPYPDTSWVTFETGLFINSAPSDIWAMKLPSYPVSDGVDRSTFIPGNIGITTPGSLGIATATVEFYYNEYGSGQQCTTRAETCLAVASSVTPSLPFYYKSTDSYTRAACASSCTIALPVLPLHTAYWQVKFYDGSGTFVQNGNSGIAIEGNVITLGVLPPTTNSATNIVGGGVRRSGK